MLSFIHKYKDGTMVKFTKVPQVRHRNTNSLSGLKEGSYLRTIRGRIAKVENIYKKEIDVTKDSGDSKRTENVYFFSCKFLDNDEKMELQASITMSRVKINIVYLFLYSFYKLFNKNIFQTETV